MHQNQLDRSQLTRNAADYAGGWMLAILGAAGLAAVAVVAVLAFG